MRTINKIFFEDQQDRKNSSFFNKPKYFSQRDKNRREEVLALITVGKIVDGMSLYKAAMIFHHGSTLAHLKKAWFLAQKSMLMKYKPAFWLYAAITDRLLMHQKKPQRFGTQYYKKDGHSPWVLYKTDPKITDPERKKYSVPPLAKTIALIKKLNKG